MARALGGCDRRPGAARGRAAGRGLLPLRRCPGRRGDRLPGRDDAAGGRCRRAPALFVAGPCPRSARPDQRRRRRPAAARRPPRHRRRPPGSPADDARRRLPDRVGDDRHEGRRRTVARHPAGPRPRCRSGSPRLRCCWSTTRSSGPSRSPTDPASRTSTPVSASRAASGRRPARRRSSSAARPRPRSASRLPVPLPTPAPTPMPGATRCSPSRRRRPPLAMRHDPHGAAALSVVPTMISAGEGINVVPGTGELSIDMRADDEASFEPVIESIPDRLDGVGLTVERLRLWPGMDMGDGGRGIARARVAAARAADRRRLPRRRQRREQHRPAPAARDRRPRAARRRRPFAGGAPARRLAR